MSESTQTNGSREERSKSYNRRQRAQSSASIVWLVEPRPLFAASRIRVCGVAVDAPPEVMEEFHPIRQDS